MARLITLSLVSLACIVAMVYGTMYGGGYMPYKSKGGYGGYNVGYGRGGGGGFGGGGGGFGGGFGGGGGGGGGGLIYGLIYRTY